MAIPGKMRWQCSMMSIRNALILLLNILLKLHPWQPGLVDTAWGCMGRNSKTIYWITGSLVFKLMPIILVIRMYAHAGMFSAP